MTNIFEQIAFRIIKEQELLIGPLAWAEAKKVSGISVIDEKKGVINLSQENPKVIIDTLVKQYERLFGKLSSEVCREAVRNIISTMPEEEIPDSLKK